MRTGPRGASNGSGGGGGLVKGLASVVGTPSAANQAPLHGTGTSGGGLPPAAGLLHAQPACSTWPGTAHLALGEE